MRPDPLRSGLARAPAVEGGACKSASNAEVGRCAIIAGWVITMLGVFGYVVAMRRAGESAGILEAFTNQGLLGWASAALLAGGILIWLLGNLAILHAAAETDENKIEL